MNSTCTFGISVLFVLAGCFSLSAQAKYRLVEFMPAQAGDSLVFQNLTPNAKEPILVAWPQTVEFRKQPVLKRTESTGSHRFETVDAEQGWQLYLIGMPNKQDIIFEKPLLLLPAEVEHGKTYKTSSPFSLFSDGRKYGSGIQQFEIRVDGHDTSRTPLQNFAECLVINTISIRTDADGVRRGYELKEWYARGFGLVKMAGEAFVLDSKGARTRIVKAAGMLEKAMIAGEGHKWN
jgi:hypothetical protein